MRASEIMTENPQTIAPTITVRAAAQTLARLAVRHLPVVNEDGELVGIVSDRDLRGAPGGRNAGDLLPAAPRATARVSDVMTSDVVQAVADDELGTIMELMIEHRVGAVPIVDGQGLLVGIVSYVDVLRALLTTSAVAPGAKPRRKNTAGKPLTQPPAPKPRAQGRAARRG